MDCWRALRWVRIPLCLWLIGHPAVAAPPLEAYGNLPQVELMRVSPSGNRIAMIGVDHEKRLLVLSEAGTNKVLRAAAVGENKIRDISWAGDDHLLVTITATSGLLYDYGNERFELGAVLHVGVDGKPPWSVFEHSDDIEHTVFEINAAFSQQGRWYGYFTGLTLDAQRGFGDHGYTRQHTYLDLYQVDLETSKPKLIAKGAGRDHEWVVGADGKVAAHSEYAQGSGEWALYSGGDRDKKLLNRVSLQQDVILVGLGRRTGTALVLDKTGKKDQALEIDTSSGMIETVLEDVAVDRFLFDPLTGALIGALTHTDPWAYFFDAALQKHYNSTRKAFPHQRVRLESFTPNLRDMIVFTDGNADPGTFWFVNGLTHHADVIGNPYPQISPSDVGVVRTFSYTASDGQALEGILTTPPGHEVKNLPLVVLPHGGPIGVDDEVGFDWWAQALASRGYAVFQPNYRGSGGKTVAFRQAGYGEWGHKMLSDISEGVSALAAQSLADPTRACIVGGSYGGYAALAAVSMRHEEYRCAVSVAGPSDMPNLLNWEAKIHGLGSSEIRYWHEVTGADRDAGALRDISPIHFVKQVDAPILVIHGRDDTRVPIEQSREMVAALKAAGKEVQYVELDKEDHFLSRDSTRITMLKSALAFIEKYNPSELSRVDN